MVEPSEPLLPNSEAIFKGLQQGLCGECEAVMLRTIGLLRQVRYHESVRRIQFRITIDGEYR